MGGGGGDVLAVYSGLGKQHEGAAAEAAHGDGGAATAPPGPGALLCHAWNGDRSMLAVSSPSSREVLVYAVDAKKKTGTAAVHAAAAGAAAAAGGGGGGSKASDTAAPRLIATLLEHDQPVSYLDWCPRRNLLLSCSHDRNCYVWSRGGAAATTGGGGGQQQQHQNTAASDGEAKERSGGWSPSLVVLRLNRAVTCGSWAPSEQKFAVGSGARSVSVCYYEPENNWYVSKLIKKKHGSTVTGVAWHSSGTLLATSCMDGHVRVFTAFVRGVDEPAGAKLPMLAGMGTKEHFGECIYELNLGCKAWVHSVTWAPTGKALVAVAHNSMLYHVSGIDVSDGTSGGGAAADVAAALGKAADVRTIMHRGLPHRSVLFLTDNSFVAAGYDNVPVIYARNTSSGEWAETRVLTGAKQEQKTSKNFGAALARFKAQDDLGMDTDTLAAPKSTSHPHSNTVTCLRPIDDDGSVTRFSSSSDDGRLVIWTTKAVTIGSTN